MPIEKINEEKCTGCRTCVNSCPMDCIRFDEKMHKAVITYAKDCIACYNCEQDCPMGAIYVNPRRGQHVPPAW